MSGGPRGIAVPNFIAYIHNYCYISPFCPVAPHGWICTEFGIWVVVADVSLARNFLLMV